MKLGQKGQAFSTFKLLIAAIVAVVILVILLSVLGIVNFNPQTDPVTGASDALDTAYQVKGMLSQSDAVMFSNGYSLTRRAIVNKASIGLDITQVCLSLGDYTDNPRGFEGGIDEGDEAKIVYNGGGTRNVKIAAVCYRGDEIEDVIDEDYPDMESDWVADCVCTDTAEPCCLIALRIAT